MTNRIIRTGDGSHFDLGNDESRSAVTAVGPLHPLNPTYNSTLPAPNASLKPKDEEPQDLSSNDVPYVKTTKRPSLAA